MAISLRQYSMSSNLSNISIVNKIVSKVDKVSSNENVSKFIKEQINGMLHNPKLRELVERVSFREDIPKEKVLKSILETLATETEQASKKQSF